MTKDEYLAKLNEAFHDFVFYPTDHHYEYKGKRVGISVTRLIEEYTQPFDAETIAQRVALKRGVSTQEVLDEWQQKNEWSCEKGSLGHEHVQLNWEDLYHPIWFDDEEKRIIINKIFIQGDNFYNDYKDKLELIANEYVVGTMDFDVASAIDALFVNKATGGLVLVDYKTNSDIHKNEKYAKFMQAPLQHLKDTILNHYNLQLSIYKFLVEKYADVKVDEMFIVYMSENIDNYEIISVEYLEKEARELLEWNIWD